MRRFTSKSLPEPFRSKVLSGDARDGPISAIATGDAFIVVQCDVISKPQNRLVFRSGNPSCGLPTRLSNDVWHFCL